MAGMVDPHLHLAIRPLVVVEAAVVSARATQACPAVPAVVRRLGVTTSPDMVEQMVETAERLTVYPVVPDNTQPPENSELPETRYIRVVEAPDHTRLKANIKALVALEAAAMAVGMDLAATEAQEPLTSAVVAAAAARSNARARAAAPESASSATNDHKEVIVWMNR